MFLISFLYSMINLGESVSLCFELVEPLTSLSIPTIPLKRESGCRYDHDLKDCWAFQKHPKPKNGIQSDIPSLKLL